MGWTSRRRTTCCASQRRRARATCPGLAAQPKSLCRAQSARCAAQPIRRSRHLPAAINPSPRSRGTYRASVRPARLPRWVARRQHRTRAHASSRGSRGPPLAHRQRRPLGFPAGRRLVSESRMLLMGSDNVAPGGGSVVGSVGAGAVDGLSVDDRVSDRPSPGFEYQRLVTALFLECMLMPLPVRKQVRRVATVRVPTRRSTQ